ncbi:MAG: ATP-dependent DNA helicase RecG, partial [Candidatus Magasanikbacteria bacterium]|nr:ATP-dependent DNA helicase RecG [Candidatus Magasanikbacteria bacterium]
MDLNSPISSLNNVGPAIAKKLKKINLSTIGDLLYHIPFRHEDFRGGMPIKDLQDGLTVSVAAKVELIGSRRSFKTRKMVTEALVSDNSGSLRIVWFNQPYVTKIIEIGSDWQFSGTVKSDMLGAQLVNPTFEKKSVTATAGAKFLPVYSVTAGLSQKLLRFLVEQALEQVKKIPDWLSEDILEEYDLLPLSAALQAVHFPADRHDLDNGFKRLKFDELFLIQLRAEISRRGRAMQKAPILDFKEKEIKEFVDKLPFALTKPQKLSAWEILKDLSKPSPMNRLLSGDVGSGKTVVAAMALYNTALNGLQSVLLAPTEILAKQHFDNITRLLSHLDIPICLYTRSQFAKNDLEENIESKKFKKEILENLKEGKIALAIGTHALLSDKIEFKKLGLAIVDEQHRFGVEQRNDIKQKGKGVHFLSLTATPIPRSLALTLYGDLDLSVIDELPAGRKPIMSRLVEVYNRQKAYDFIRAQIKQGRQAFVVCPLIENDSGDKKSVLAEYEKLSKKIFPDLKVDFLHGRLKSVEKESAMRKFKNHET